MDVTKTWTHGDSQSAIPQLKDQLEKLRQQRTNMQRAQLQETQSLQQQIKVAQDRQDYDSGKKLEAARFELEARWKETFRVQDEQERKANQNLQTAQQNEERFEQQNKQNQPR